MSAEHSVALAGERLTLLGERAVYWPAQQSLLIADLHLGKADSLRRAGILTPRGSTSSDLQRLQALVDRYRPQTLWVLGDMLHGPLHTAPWLQRWQQFRERYSELAVKVIAGNHDRVLTGTSSSAARDALGIQVQSEARSLGGLRLCHQASPEPALPTLSGHLHPVIRLPGLPRRLPAFVQSPNGLLLPAFSRLTGGLLMDHRGGGCFACVEGEIVAVSGLRAEGC